MVSFERTIFVLDVLELFDYLIPNMVNLCKS